jgi:hypothetical protein
MILSVRRGGMQSGKQMVAFAWASRSLPTSIQPSPG